MKNLCSKCKSEQFNIEYIIKGKKTKYYRICEQCKKRKRIFPKYAAYHCWLYCCDWEAYNLCKDEHFNELDTKTAYDFLIKRKAITKKYKYIYYNLIIFIEYVFRNNLHKFYSNETFTMPELWAILRQQKKPVDDNLCKDILNNLLKI
jgi:hypothetical protein